ncbi:MAG: hypothetical protein L3K07_01755, partial [Thermoplasmata archaeon]|nr:hypothetical protein [Thermoplasmata archaeon]
RRQIRDLVVRMHRGSSKGTRDEESPPETLPLSASPAATVVLEFELVRGGRSELRSVEVPVGTLLRVALRSISQPPEGSAVLRGELPIPLDTPLRVAERLTVVPTFSGG